MNFCDTVTAMFGFIAVP